MKDEIQIERENVILKSLSCQDSEQYRLLRNDDSIRNYFYHNEIISREVQSKWYERYKSTVDDYMFSVYHKLSETFIGGVALYNIDHVVNSAEVGRIIIDKKFKGHEYGSVAVDAVVTWGYERLGITHFYASIYEHNYASLQTFLKCGFIVASNECAKVRVEKHV